MRESDKGELSFDLPGSKSVACEESTDCKLGSPADTRRANYGHEPGRSSQRQEESSDGKQGFGSVHSSSGHARSSGTKLDEGADTPTQPAQETSTVRTTESSWPTSLRAIAKKAAQTKTHRLGGLYGLLTEDSLRECFYHLRKEAAPGVDGVTFQEYEKNLEGNLSQLVRRLKQKRYHARLVRRKYIPKGPGKWRPLGIPALEDKLLQCAVAEILLAIYEADFLPCSYGYRLGRGAHQATRELTDTLFRGRFEFVVEADIKGYFEHIRWDWLERMLKLRIHDGALLGLIRKWLRAGILEEDGRVVHPETGTPQGGSVSPVLANVYLHYVLDLWFERRVRKGNRGQSRLFRFADDYVCCFDCRHEAQAFMKALPERLAKFGLELAPDKTRLIRFGKGGGPRNERFDFLGFEFRWEPSWRTKRPVVKRRTSRKKLQNAVARFTEWIRAERHQKLPQLMKTLAAKYHGHWNYYGLIGNWQSLAQYAYQTQRILFKWLNRRSQRKSYSWEAFNRLLKRFKVPPPRIVEKVQGRFGLPSRLGWSMAQVRQTNLFGRSYRASRA
jgi:group II intron reverse transcriptase/maturase